MRTAELEAQLEASLAATAAARSEAGTYRAERDRATLELDDARARFAELAQNGEALELRVTGHGVLIEQLGPLALIGLAIALAGVALTLRPAR